MRVTLFRRATDTAPDERELEWSEFTRQAAHPYPCVDKLDAPAFSFARYNGSRSNRSVTEFSGLALDFDDVPDASLPGLFALIQAHRSFVYTTHSHPRKPNRIRAVFPYPSPILPGRQETVVRAYSTYFGHPTDAKANPSGLFFLPSHHPAEKPPHVYTFEGPLLDPWRLPDTYDVTPAMMHALAVKTRRRKGVTEEQIALSLSLDQLQLGEPYAPIGERDSTCWRLACWLGNAFPGLDPVRVAARFEQSHQNMGSGAPNALDKLKRAVSSKSEELEECEIRQREYYTIRGQPTRLGHLTATELERLGNPHLTHGAIYQADKAYFLRTVDGFSGPFLTDAESQIRRDLSVLPGVELTYPSGERKPVQQLMAEHGQAVLSVLYSLRARESSYDPSTGTLTLATAPLRRITPARSTFTEEWFDAAFGDQRPIVEAWLSWLPELSVPLAMLFLRGEPNTGKDLFGACCARLWSASGACRASEILGTNFNDALLRSPFVWANEEWPKIDRRPVIEGFKDLISADTIPLRRKFLDNARIQGYVRLLATANTDLLLSGFSGTPESNAAIAQRVVRVILLPRAADFLRPYSGNRLREYVARDEFAAHVLQLQRPASQGRFQIQAHSEAFALDLATSSEWGSQVCQWLTSYLSRRLSNRPGAPVHLADGQVWVHAGLIYSNWHLVGEVPRPVSARFLGDMFAPFYLPGRRDVNGSKFRPVDVSKLVHWAVAREVATAAEVMSWLDPTTNVIPLRK